MSNRRRNDDSERMRSRSSSYSSRSRSRSRSREDDEQEEEGVRLHVADLDMNVSKKDLQYLFEKYGKLKEVWLARSPPCFAFVVFKDKESAEEAVKCTDGMNLAGTRIRVSFARPRTRGRGRRGYDPSMRCYQCGERGHFSRDCIDSKEGGGGYKRPHSRMCVLVMVMR